LWVLALATVIWGSLLPEAELLYWGASIPLLLWNDKVIHFSAYLGLSLLAALSFARAYRALGAAIGMIFLGAALEIGQLFVNGRTADFKDALANSVGALAGAGLAFWARWRITGFTEFRRPKGTPSRPS
jgi:hypothetical protein